MLAGGVVEQEAWDGVRKKCEEELGRVEAGLAWQAWPPLSSAGAVRFPKRFWAAQEEQNPCSSLLGWAGGREKR